MSELPVCSPLSSPGEASSESENTYWLHRMLFLFLYSNSMLVTVMSASAMSQRPSDLSEVSTSNSTPKQCICCIY